MSAIKQSVTGTGNIVLGANTLTVAGTSSVSGTNTGDQTSVTGNAGTATALATARNIFNISFNGTANVAGDATNTGHFASIPGTGAAGHFVTENGTAPTLIAGRSAWYSDGSGVPSFKNGTGTAVTLVRSSDIGVSVQAFDADLTTWAGITPSANVQTLLGAANYAAFRTSLGLGTLATKDVPVCTSYKRSGANQTLTNGTAVTLAFPTAIKADASFNGTTFTAPATGYATVSGLFSLFCAATIGDSERGILTVIVRDATAAADVWTMHPDIYLYFGTFGGSQSIYTPIPIFAPITVTSGHTYQIFVTWDNGGDDATTDNGSIEWEMKP